MKIKSYALKWDEMEARRSVWHIIFLWWPTSVSPTEVKWGIWYQRKGQYNDCDYGGWWTWEWKPMNDEKEVTNG